VALDEVCPLAGNTREVDPAETMALEMQVHFFFTRGISLVRE
jgi:hypothetical protein